MKLTGTSFIGFARGAATGVTFTAFDPSTGDSVGPDYHSATADELGRAAELAAAARIPFARVSGRDKANFLRTIAANIEALGDELLARVSLETGLPNARVTGERGRTCFQLRMFADLIEKGDWVDARLDSPDAARQPLPKPDVRSMLRPLGPVAVFCASNFPLAFSVAGGDTASALAAGCPVIVNAHFAHPGTAEMIAGAISSAVRECVLPEGVFSLLFSKGYEIGQQLVGNNAIKAVGFTGSRNGGLALMQIAAARNEPIPVYAEMSSVNPMFILPGAMRERGAALAAGLHASVTTGAGQFCTKPGLVFVPAGGETGDFKSGFAKLIRETPPQSLLTSGIRENFESLSAARSISRDGATNELRGYGADALIFETNATDFLKNEDLAEEIFGPTTLLIESASKEELLAAARALEGQLTATIHGTAEDLADNTELIEVLETKAGRLIFNGFPTGVEVGSAMVHGGPFPATSDSRSTSVGTRAIERFCRAVCYQNFPDEFLPAELRDANPLGIMRLTDGEKK